MTNRKPSLRKRSANQKRITSRIVSRERGKKKDNLDDSGICDSNDVSIDLMPDSSSSIGKRVHSDVPTGRRILSCSNLLQTVANIGQHFKTCDSPDITYGGEIRSGLKSELIFFCNCGWKTSFKSDGDEECLPLNDALGLGILNAPIAFNAFSYLLTPMEIPYPSKKLFTKIQNQMGQQVVKAAKISMKDVGKEESTNSMQCGDFITLLDKDGNLEAQIPQCTVVVDGAWTKRSYGHSYNSNYGVGVIMGRHTGKVLAANIRQKVCFVCSFFRGRGKTPPPEHLPFCASNDDCSTSDQCSKNWDKPSTAMEADSILEGFRNSIQDHGLMYDCFVGDGDSSVHLAVINVYDKYGIQVKKIECINHMVRNLNSHLRRIGAGKVVGKNSKPITTEERGLSGMEDRFRRIGLAVHGAATYYNQRGVSPDHIKHLGDDITNIPFHIFGRHDKCKEYFCRRKDTEKDLVSKMQTTGIWSQLTPVIHRVASNAASLIEKQNSNIVECFMSTVNRFVEGKRNNLGGRFLYEYKIASSVLSHNIAGFFGGFVLQTCYGKEPNDLWNKCKKESLKRRNNQKQAKKTRKIKFGFLKQGDKHYGANPATPPLSPDDLAAAVGRLASSLNVDQARQLEIEELTRLQSDNDMWFVERRQRITASIAGRICKLRDSTDNTATLRELLGHTRTVNTPAVRHGRDHENDAIKAYEVIKGMEIGSVKRCGLYISLENGIIGASPDGLVGDDGLIEVKCPYTLQDMPPTAWVDKAATPIKLDSRLLDCYDLSKKHNYYYQVVTQIHVTNRKWCDFVVWTKKGLLVIRIHRSIETQSLWEKIKTSLNRFWMNDLAPELVDPSVERGLEEYHCPAFRQKARDASKAKKLSKIRETENSVDVAMETD